MATKKHPEADLRVRQIAIRLKEERALLGLTVEAAAEHCFVSKSTQYEYESGTRLPDALYLHFFAQQGADVLYVVSGQRSAPVGARSAEGEDLARRYSRLAEPDRHALMSVLQLAERSPPQKRPR